MRVKYLGGIDTPALEKNKVYDVLSIEKGWYRIMTELEEDHIFPSEQFQIVTVYCTVKNDEINGCDCLIICDVADRYIKSSVLPEGIEWGEEQCEKCKKCIWHDDFDEIKSALTEGKFNNV